MNDRAASSWSRVTRFVVMMVMPLSACFGVAQAVNEPVVYYCVGGAAPVPPPNTLGKKYTTEEFDFGDYRVNASTISKGIFGHSRCGNYTVPSAAYLRYRVDGQVVEKRFDLSALTPGRVANKTVEFYVEDEHVEVRLLTPRPGVFTENVEVITRQ